MKTNSYHILRIGLGITFVWIGILIITNPTAWGGFVSPWVIRFLPISINLAMMINGVFDLSIGIMLLFNLFVWLAATLAALHLVIVLIVTGINDVTIRDIGLLASAIALGEISWPNVLLTKEK